MVFYNFVTIFEVNIVSEQKQTKLITIFLLFICCQCPHPVYCPPALSLLWRPCIQHKGKQVIINQY